jgi:hypothetical protein
MRIRAKDTLLAAGKILHAEEVQPIPGGLLWLGGASEENLVIKGDADHCESMKIAIATMSEQQKRQLRATLKKYGDPSMKLQTGPQGGAAVTDAAASNRESYAASAKMNDDAKAFWADRVNRGLYDAAATRPRLRVNTGSLAAEMNAEARRFWNQDAT